MLFLAATTAVVATCFTSISAATASSSQRRHLQQQQQQQQLDCTNFTNFLIDSANVDIACENKSCEQCVPELNPCNNAIFDISKDDILMMMTLLLPEKKIKEEATEAATTTAAITNSILERLPELVKWNVRVHKICTTCAEMNTLWEKQHDAQASVAMPYCDTGKFASGKTMSGLVLEPIDPYNNKPVVGEVATTLFSMDISTNPLKAFSEIKDLDGLFDKDTIYPLLTASSGTYTIVPDVLGNGEDWKSTRSYRVKDVYQASTIPLLLKLQEDVGTKYNCTVLDKRVAIVGYGGEGGYSAAAIAEAMDMLDDGYVHTFTAVGGAPISTAKEQLKEIVAFDSGTYPSPALIVRFANAYSSTNQDLDNTNLTNIASKEYLNATDESQKDVRSWIEYGLSDETILSLLPTPKASEIINPDILGPLLESYTLCSDEPFKTDATGNFCAAVIQNDLSSFLMNVEYPVVLCHSPNDEVSYYANVEKIPEANEYILMIENMPSFVGQVISPFGTHEKARQQCLLGYVLQYSEPGDIRTIKPPEDEGCVISYTESPTSLTTLLPTTLSPTATALQGASTKGSDGPTSAASTINVDGISALVMSSTFLIFAVAAMK